MMTTATVRYDANALALGQWVMRETGAEIAILFGSRARGDYRRDSDIDLLLVHPRWDEIRRRAREAATAKAESLYDRWMEVNLAWFTPQEFEHLRRTINGVAAIAIEEGFTMDGQPAGNEYGNDQEDYSNEWSQTEQRCHHTRSHLHLFRGAIDLTAANIMIGQQAHQTLEHAMKALISASGRRYPHHHHLVTLEQDTRRFDRGFTQSLESDLIALNDYSGRLKYDETYLPLGDREELFRKVLTDTQKIFERVALLTGKDPWQEQPGEDCYTQRAQRVHRTNR